MNKLESVSVAAGEMVVSAQAVPAAVGMKVNKPKSVHAAPGKKMISARPGLAAVRMEVKMLKPVPASGTKVGWPRSLFAAAL